MNLALDAHPAQLDFSSCRDVPYVGFVGGRGAGKSFAASLRLLRWGCTEPGLYGMYAPTYPLLHDTILRSFSEIARPVIKRTWGAPTNIELISGAEILCRSLDDPERARGPSLKGAVWDEASLCAQEAFDILIACLRYEGKQGWLACTFTPKGPSHWTADVFNDPARSDVRCFHARTDQNPFNPPNFRDTLARQYTTQFAIQELDGCFISLEGGIAKAEWFPVAPVPPEFRPVAIVRFWDFAASKKKTGDFTASGKVARMAGGRYVLMEVTRDKVGPGELERLVQSTARRDGPQTLIRFEQEPSAGAQHYASTLVRMLGGYNVRAIRPQGDKVLRAGPLLAQAEHGNVTLFPGSWVRLFHEELRSFPNGEHDDMVDAVAGAFSEVCDSGAGYAAIA